MVCHLTETCTLTQGRSACAETVYTQKWVNGGFLESLAPCLNGQWASRHGRQPVTGEASLSTASRLSAAGFGAALPQPDGSARGCCGRGVLQSRVDVARDREEGLLDVDVALCRNLKELQPVLSREPLPPLGRDAALADERTTRVRLVAEEHFVDRVGGVLLDGPHPRGDVGERVLVGDVVDEEDAHGAAVVGRRDGLEPLLPRRVPDLQFDSLAVQLHAPDLKVDPNRGDEGLREGVVGKPHQNRALPHACAGGGRDRRPFGHAAEIFLSCLQCAAAGRGQWTAPDKGGEDGGRHGKTPTGRCGGSSETWAPCGRWARMRIHAHRNPQSKGV
mmetsp:Transcript_8145/g.24159  ORF Transcript_8145/g.24159 Transcript_8145/m.24159 type:complete len:333 (+) Transcript_8145:266-1264(+)